jgi:L-ascorbate metabolism protein UlaG (beta-lactamase superfamily)
MATQITFIGHSCFQVETRGRTLLIDPFVTGNPQATVKAEDLNPDVIIVSHGHGDHIGDTVDLARRCGSLVISNHEISQWLQAQGLENLHGMHIGGGRSFDFGHVKLTIAHHGSALPDGTNGGNPAGILLTTDDGVIYHACDTGLFYDMKLIGESGVDVAILPIGDNYTMGPVDAVRAVNLLQPKTVIPCHWNTFPVIEQDAAAWAETVRESTAAVPLVLTPGESVQLVDGRCGGG